MSFFNRRQKKLALACKYNQLQEAYHESEKDLRMASRSGNEKLLRKAMKQHGDFEYALLFKNTPEYKNLIKRGKRKHVKD